jgi:hypothetical protein
MHWGVLGESKEAKTKRAETLRVGKSRRNEQEQRGTKEKLCSAVLGARMVYRGMEPSKTRRNMVRRVYKLRRNMFRDWSMPRRSAERCGVGEIKEKLRNKERK